MSITVFQVDSRTGAVNGRLRLNRIMNAGRVQVARLYHQGNFDWLVPDPYVLTQAEKLQRQKFNNTERDLGLYLYVKDFVRQLEGFPKQPPQCLICEVRMLQRLQQAGNLTDYQPREEVDHLLKQMAKMEDGDVIAQLFALYNVLQYTIETRIKAVFSDPTPSSGSLN